jgi:hypothetical protein
MLTDVTLAKGDEQMFNKKCRHYNSGHCKFEKKGNGCKFFHSTELCGKERCKTEFCMKRHPKKCKFGSQCIFQNRCSYLHSEIEGNQGTETMVKEIAKLKKDSDAKVNSMAKVHLREIDELKTENKILRQRIQATEAKQLEAENQSLQTEIEDLKKVIKASKLKIEKVTNDLNSLKETSARTQTTQTQTTQTQTTQTPTQEVNATEQVTVSAPVPAPFLPGPGYSGLGRQPPTKYARSAS